MLSTNKRKTCEKPVSKETVTSHTPAKLKKEHKGILTGSPFYSNRRAIVHNLYFGIILSQSIRLAEFFRYSLWFGRHSVLYLFSFLL